MTEHVRCSETSPTGAGSCYKLEESTGVVESGKRVHVPLRSGLIFSDFVLDNVRLSFHSVLRGPTLRSARVFPVLPLGDYMVAFTAPPMPGWYELDVRVRWVGGMEEPGQRNVTKSRFLGGPGREHYLKSSEYGKRERMTVVQERPNRIQLALANKTRDLGDSQPCTRESVTGIGYWCKPDSRPTSTTRRLGLCHRPSEPFLGVARRCVLRAVLHSFSNPKIFGRCVCCCIRGVLIQGILPQLCSIFPSARWGTSMGAPI